MRAVFTVPPRGCLDTENQVRLMTIEATPPSFATMQALQRQALSYVAPDFDSIRLAISSRITSLPRRDERIHIDAGQDGAFTIDLATGSLDRRQGDPEPNATLTAGPRTFARILNGSREPRGLLLFGALQIRGQMESGLRLCDELSGNWFPRQEQFTALPLPMPTKDRVLARRHLEEFGYCMIADALSCAELAALRARLDEQAAAEMAAGIAYFEGGRGATEDRRGFRGDIVSNEASAAIAAPNQRVWLLHNKGDAFIDLLDNSVISEFVPGFLDEDYPLLGQYSANVVGPGSEAQFLHQDQHPVQPATHFPIAVNTLFCLDDFTEENGATCIIPGSHIVERGLTPANIYSTQGTSVARAPAGSAIVLDSRLWHGAGVNTTGRSRRAIIMLTQRSWTRAVNNGALGVHPTVLAKLSDRAKSLFGFRVTGGLGSIQTESEGSLVGWDPNNLVLEMHLKAAG